MIQDESFKAWWYSEGSKAPYKHHDCEEHTMRMCEIAWANGAYIKQEDIIQIIKETPFSNWFQADVIEAIKARGEQA
jgi:predicted DCC family thiol-disulfide oxidoreductase YuxK